MNIHHFILDGAIWKLRDGRIAALLLNSREHVAEAATGAAGRFVTDLALADGEYRRRPLPARRNSRCCCSPGGQSIRSATISRCVPTTCEDLQQAATSTPLTVPCRRAWRHREMEDGDLPEAEAAWRKAMQANPADPAPRQALLRFLIDQNRFDEAFDLTQSSLTIRAQGSEPAG